MSLFENNPNFYPTPSDLILKMICKVDWNKVKTVLEPSAGKGDIIEKLKITYTTRYANVKVSAIEVAPTLQATLRGKGFNVIDSDFLTYNGLDQFDLIIANPPFDNGDRHLLKMIDIMFSGQIVCLLNAETLKNPYSNTRKDLLKRLNDLGAEIEYIKGAFTSAERKTGVETALIYIKKYQEVETALFDGMKEDVTDINVGDIEERHDIATRNTIGNLVMSYNIDRDAVINQLMEFYRNHKAVGKYLTLSVIGEEVERWARSIDAPKGELTKIMKGRINAFSAKIKEDYWKKAIKLDEINRRLTSKKREEIYNEINLVSSMEFTESNIRQFVINIIDKYPVMIDEAIQYLFDEFTGYALRAADRNWGDSEYLNNIHYYNGWKTNNAYRINKKVIIPFRLDSNWGCGYRLDYKQEIFLDDLDMVMDYFSGKTRYVRKKDEDPEMKEYEYIGTKDVIKLHFEERGDNRKISTEYFYISIFKKGTMHIEFKDMDLLRRFNIAACKGKAFLPHDYSHRPFKDLNTHEKEMVKQFEGEKSYTVIPGELALSTRITDTRFLIGA